MYVQRIAFDLENLARQEGAFSGATEESAKAKVLPRPSHRQTWSQSAPA